MGVRKSRRGENYAGLDARLHALLLERQVLKMRKGEAYGGALSHLVSMSLGNKRVAQKTHVYGCVFKNGYVNPRVIDRRFWRMCSAAMGSGEMQGSILLVVHKLR